MNPALVPVTTDPVVKPPVRYLAWYCDRLIGEPVLDTTDQEVVDIFNANADGRYLFWIGDDSGEISQADVDNKLANARRSYDAFLKRKRRMARNLANAKTGETA